MVLVFSRVTGGRGGGEGRGRERFAFTTCVGAIGPRPDELDSAVAKCFAIIPASGALPNGTNLTVYC